MTPETLQHYGPCEKHGTWYDLKEGYCFHCLCEAVNEA